MSRTHRLFDLLQLLRRRRTPVTAEALARELGVSVRTLYRDIAGLQALGAEIDGEAGLGYRLRPGFVLPPLMFSTEEIEALVLGTSWVADRGDPKLADAARQALAKITSVVPPDRRDEILNTTLLIGPDDVVRTVAVDVAEIRRAMREQRKLQIAYTDGAGSPSRRTVWPFALGYFNRVQALVTWCELRRDFRNFRTDRITALRVLAERAGRTRRSLLKEWSTREDIDLEDS